MAVHKFEDFLRSEAARSGETVRRHAERVAAPAVMGMFSVEERAWLDRVAPGRRLDEGLLDDIRAGIEKMKGSEVGQAVLAKARRALETVRTFAQYVADLFRRAWDKILAYMMKRFDPVKRTIIEDARRAQSKGKYVGQNARQELHNLNDTVSFWLRDWVMRAVVAMKAAFTKGLDDAATKTEGFVDALSSFDPGNVNESKFFDAIAAISHRIEKVPPFDVLSGVKHLAETGAAKFLNEFSKLTGRAGGPGPFTFVTTAVIAGFFVEYYVKHIGMASVDEVLSSEAILKLLPMAREVIMTVEIVALVVCVVDTVVELSDSESELVSHKKGKS